MIVHKNIGEAPIEGKMTISLRWFGQVKEVHWRTNEESTLYGF